MGSREDRRGRNEALFREVNEQIAELGERHRANRLQIVCECSNAACSEPISISVSEYEEARSDPLTFIVRIGHVDATVERAVTQHRDHMLVQKLGDAAAAAIATDPR